MTIFWKSRNLTILPYLKGGGYGVCVGSMYVCVWGGGGVRENVCYHIAAFVIPFNLLHNMTIVWKKVESRLIDPTPKAAGAVVRAK